MSKFVCSETVIVSAVEGRAPGTNGAYTTMCGILLPVKKIEVRTLIVKMSSRFISNLLVDKKLIKS